MTVWALSGIETLIQAGLAVKIGDGKNGWLYTELPGKTVATS